MSEISKGEEQKEKTIPIIAEQAHAVAAWVEQIYTPIEQQLLKRVEQTQQQIGSDSSYKPQLETDVTAFKLQLEQIRALLRQVRNAESVAIVMSEKGPVFRTQGENTAQLTPQTTTLWREQAIPLLGAFQHGIATHLTRNPFMSYGFFKESPFYTLATGLSRIGSSYQREMNALYPTDGELAKLDITVSEDQSVKITGFPKQEIVHTPVKL